MDVKIPDFAESVTEGDLGRWLKSDGDFVRKDEPLLEIETDKTTLEVPAPASGRLSVAKEEGETVTGGDVVGSIDESAEDPGESEDDGDDSKDEDAKDSDEDTGKDAGKDADEDSDEDAGGDSGRKSETSSKRDDESKSRRRSEPAASRGEGKEPRGRRPEPARREPEPEPDRPDEPGTRRERMSRLRRAIAERLVDAQRTAAILTTFNELDMSALIELRKQNQEWFRARHGVKLGYVSLFAKAACTALKEIPEINAFIDGHEIVYHDHVHLGVAVGTERGLVVPVVRNANSLSLGELETEIQRLAGLARDGGLALDDLQGGTFTVSNGGVYGSMLSTPILNPPQSGILGMHSIEQRPKVLEDGTIAARAMMFVALSYDHRIVDGKEAVTFLVRLKQLLEDPERMLLEA